MVNFRKNSPKYRIEAKRDSLLKELDALDALEAKIKQERESIEQIKQDFLIREAEKHKELFDDGKNHISDNTKVTNTLQPDEQSFNTDYKGPVQRKGFANMRRKQSDTPEADEQTFYTDYQAAEKERGKETVEDLKRILKEEAILEAKRVDAKTCMIEPFRNPKGEIRYLIRDVHGKIVSNAEGHGFKSTLTADRFLWVRYIQPLENK